MGVYHSLSIHGKKQPRMHEWNKHFHIFVVAKNTSRYAQKNNPVFVYSWRTKKQFRLTRTNGKLPLRGRLSMNSEI
jgi:hypothetical protein